MAIKYRVGNGIDVHPLVKGRKLILGGIHIKNKFGCAGHSDGDVLVHSIIDALLGAINKGDIGDYFPSSDKKYKDASSINLLSETIKQIKPWGIGNIDSTIILQSPNGSRHLPGNRIDFVLTVIKPVVFKLESYSTIGINGF